MRRRLGCGRGGVLLRGAAWGCRRGGCRPRGIALGAWPGGTSAVACAVLAVARPCASPAPAAAAGCLAPLSAAGAGAAACFAPLSLVGAGAVAVPPGAAVSAAGIAAESGVTRRPRSCHPRPLPASGLRRMRRAARAGASAAGSLERVLVLRSHGAVPFRESAEAGTRAPSVSTGKMMGAGRTSGDRRHPVPRPVPRADPELSCSLMNQPSPTSVTLGLVQHRCGADPEENMRKAVAGRPRGCGARRPDRLPAGALPQPVLLPGRGPSVLRPGRADSRALHRGADRARGASWAW